MVRTAVFPGWLGWLGIIVALLYLLGLIGRLLWKPLATAQATAFFLFLSFVLLTGLHLFGAL
jgi:hypothetical protein